MEGGLNVDCGDVVSQKQDLVGVQFAGVLPGEVLWLDEPGLEKADDEGTGAGKRVQDMHTLVADRAAELLLEDVVDRAENEVDDLDRRIDHAHGVGGAGESVLEEAFVQLRDDLLLALSVVDLGSAQAHGLVEGLQ